MARLLLDQNLSPRLATRLADVFHGSAHVSDFRLDRASDVVVWAVARDEGFVLVSKDADFPEMAALRGAPPCVVWIRHGNRSTDDTEALLRASGPAIEALVADPSAAVLRIG